MEKIDEKYLHWKNSQSRSQIPKNMRIRCQIQWGARIVTQILKILGGARGRGRGRGGLADSVLHLPRKISTM